MVFLDQQVVPRNLRGKWCRCLHFCKHTQLKVTHVFREKNHRADKLADLSLIYRE